MYFGQYLKKASWISSPSFLRRHEMVALGELAFVTVRVGMKVRL